MAASKGAHDDRLPPKPAELVLSMNGVISAPFARAAVRRPGQNYARRYWAFAIPAGIVVITVMVFPWVFTLFMSVNDWHIGGTGRWAGLANYAHMLDDERFQWAIVRTLYFTALSVLRRWCWGSPPRSASTATSLAAASRGPSSSCR